MPYANAFHFFSHRIISPGHPAVPSLGATRQNGFHSLCYQEGAVYPSVASDLPLSASGGPTLNFFQLSCTENVSLVKIKIARFTQNYKKNYTGIRCKRKQRGRVCEKLAAVGGAWDSGHANGEVSPPFWPSLIGPSTVCQVQLHGALQSMRRNSPSLTSGGHVLAIAALSLVILRA
jgi:hypothetical protein